MYFLADTTVNLESKKIKHKKVAEFTILINKERKKMCFKGQQYSYGYQ